MFAEYRDLFHEWSVAVERAIRSITDRVKPRRHVSLIEGDEKIFTAKMTSKGGASLPDFSFHLSNGQPDPPLPADWASVLSGSRVEFLLRPDQVLFRSLDFPGRAVEFLDRIIGSQIDRLTPWPAQEAVFGWSPPLPVEGDRIQLTLAATSKSSIRPFLQFVGSVGARSVAVFAAAPPGEAAAGKFKIYETSLRSATGQKADMARILRVVLLGSGLAALASLVVATYVGDAFEAEQQDLLRRISERRASMRLDQTAGSGSAQALLVKRKQTTASSVMVLEAISRVLPDTTYVTELRIDGDKVQVVGISQDSPSLIRLMEQSPLFSSATFFAPTTRAQGDPGERFHIEAQLKAYFGSGT